MDHYLQSEIRQPGHTVMISAFSSCKKLLLTIFQLFGIMMTLVGANLLTSMLEPATIPSTLFNVFNQTNV